MFMINRKTKYSSMCRQTQGQRTLVVYTNQVDRTVYFCNHIKAHFITSETNISIEPKEKS